MRFQKRQGREVVRLSFLHLWPLWQRPPGNWDCDQRFMEMAGLCLKDKEGSRSVRTQETFRIIPWSSAFPAPPPPTFFAWS